MSDRADVDDAVRQQYEAYSYPPPLTDLTAWAEKGFVQACDPSFFSAQLWPEGRPRQALNILVAGCGTNQAAQIAFANRGCNVVGIDLSQASLDHERYLKEKHSLDNLRLARMDLREVASLGEAFDLIKCTGVLHHMEAPGEGLNALASVLAADGVLHGMVYAANRRAGVYLLQDVFRRLGLGQNGADIKVARDVVAALPEHHYFHWFRRVDAANEFANDAAFVDLLLHPRDRAYSVPELVALIDRAGLAFQDWEDNRYYYADTHYGSESPIARRLRPLPQADQWAVVDNLVLQAPHHAFLACHPGQLAQRRPEFEGDPVLDTFPVRRPDLTLTREGTYYVLSRPSVRVRLTEAESFLIRMADGIRSLREIVAHEAWANHPEEVRRDFAREGCRRMWQRGHIFISRVRRSA